MKIFIKTLLALAAIGSTPLLAACPAVKKVAVVQHAAPLAVQYAAVAIVPSYGASYGNPYQRQQQADDLTNELLRQLIDEIRALRAEVKGSNQQAAAGSTTIDANKLFVSERGCIKCHEVDKAEKLGGGVVLLEKGDKLPPFSITEKNVITRKVNSGAMPPPKSGIVLSAAEKAALLAWLFPKPEEK
jgi:hypothetical protein